MYADAKLKLQGAFKVDVYDGSTKQLKQAGDYFTNYITETGLNYPFDLCFAETFRFLHIGSGNQANSSTTKWLQIPDPDYCNLIKYQEDGCGYIEHLSGVSLFRAWTVPETGVFTENHVFKEFGVSPNWSGYPVIETQIEAEASGYDWASLPLYYKTSGFDTLFARAVKTVDLFSGDFAVVTYKLNLTVRTGIYAFTHTILDASQANKDCGGNSAYDVWTGFSGRYTQFHHGLALVAPEDELTNQAFPSAVPTEPLDYVDPEFATLGFIGGSFVPSIKVGLEPSLQGKNLVCYFSNEGYQFLVNPWSGGGFNGDTTVSGNQIPYDPSGKIPLPHVLHSGLPAYQYNLQTLKDYSKAPFDDTWDSFDNMRYKADAISVPKESNFLAGQEPDNLIVRRHDSVSLSRSSNIPLRTRTVARTFTFAAINNGPGIKLESLKAIDMGFKGSDSFVETPDQPVFPILDALFVPANVPLLPELDIVTGVTGYNHIDPSNQTEYIFLDECNTFGWTFNITWSSPP